MTEPTRRELLAREAALVAELDSRKTVTQRQVDAALAGAAERDASDTRSATERQVAHALRKDES